MPELTGDFEFMLPSISQFIIMVKAQSGQKYKMVITDTTLYAWNENFQVALRLPQQDGERVKLDDIIGLLAEVKTTKSRILKLETKTVQEFIANSRFAYDKDSLFELTADDKGQTMELKGMIASTKLKESLAKPVKSINFKCDLIFFAAIVGKVKGNTFDLKVSESLVRLKVGPISYLMSLV